MKSISILGSTGSIGCNTLKVIEHLKDFRVVGLAAGSNMELFAEQIAQFRPEIVSCRDEECGEKLRSNLKNAGIPEPKIEFGEAGLISVATESTVKTVVSAAVGAVGFLPTLRAIEAGKRIALANKETLVIAGDLMTAAAERYGAELLPVDSEHNALHQCLRGETKKEVKRLILTASGGPFRTTSKSDIENASIEDALNHPNWKMGDKITIDSATLMNKGFEVIEARWLFGFDADQISVVVHPQSIVHSMVEMIDGSVIAQMGVTDMRHAIQYALTYPERIEGCMDSLDLTKLSSLEFEQPDLECFPCLNLAFRALALGGTAPAALNAANEISVAAFLGSRIKLSDIARVNEKVLNDHIIVQADSIESILEADRSAREAAEGLISSESTAVAV